MAGTGTVGAGTSGGRASVRMEATRSAGVISGIGTDGGSGIEIAPAPISFADTLGTSPQEPELQAEASTIAASGTLGSVASSERELSRACVSATTINPDASGRYAARVSSAICPGAEPAALSTCCSAATPIVSVGGTASDFGKSTRVAARSSFDGLEAGAEARAAPERGAPLSNGRARSDQSTAKFSGRRAVSDARANEDVVVALPGRSASSRFETGVLVHAAQRHQGLSGMTSQLRTVLDAPTLRLRTSSATRAVPTDAADRIAIDMRTRRDPNEFRSSYGIQLSPRTKPQDQVGTSVSVPIVSAFGSEIAQLPVDCTTVGKRSRKHAASSCACANGSARSTIDRIVSINSGVPLRQSLLHRFVSAATRKRLSLPCSTLKFSAHADACTQKRRSCRESTN